MAAKEGASVHANNQVQSGGRSGGQGQLLTSCGQGYNPRFIPGFSPGYSDKGGHGGYGHGSHDRRGGGGNYGGRGGRGVHDNFDNNFYGSHGGYHGCYHGRGHAGGQFPSRGRGAAGWKVGPDHQQELLQEMLVGGTVPPRQLGHVLTDCTTIIHCGMCDSDNHVTKACPYQKGAKPTTIPCGFAVVGLGFYYIPYNGKEKAPRENKVTVVKVTKGSMTMANVIAELDRLLPNYKGTWIVEEKGPNRFATTFPSSEDLKWMVLWGPVVTKNVEAVMEIEESGDKNIYKYEIPKVWIQFRGLPKDFLEFPIIWAMRSILGSTQMVDMKFTNEHNTARLKVAVLALELIPEWVDVVIGDYEENVVDPVPINMGINPKVDEDNDGNVGEKKGEFNNENTNGNDNITGSKDGINGKATPSMGSSHSGAEPWKAEVMPVCGVVKKGVCQQQEKPKNLTTNAYVMPTRSSKRNAVANDEDSVEKATKLKAKKNLDVTQNK
uniref:DUF4283 domain-containing protein n=1 Tax=Setaria italica TaxID=4555 RepID=K3XPB8_SETIT